MPRRKAPSPARLVDRSLPPLLALLPRAESEAGGDRALAWLEQHAPETVPTGDELSSVTAIPQDHIEPSAYDEGLFFADSPLRFEELSTDELVEHFRRVNPAAIQSDRGARFNAWRRAHRAHV
jgi:hypothetical protein